MNDNLLPGDFILTQTPTQIFSLFRDMGQTKYDHLVIVIDEQRSLHISYPLAKLVPTTMFLDPSKRPLVLRCSQMSLIDKMQMVEEMKHTIVGRPYDYKRVLHFFIN